MRQCARWDQTSTVNASKVTLNLLSDHIEDHIMIKSFSQTSFLLHNDRIRIIGPAVFFPREVLHWNVKDFKDIDEASLSLFTLLDPKVDILLIGVGHKVERLSQEAMNYLRGNKINFEILTTEKACALFNFLNGEKRQVVAAMIPPVVIEDSMMLPEDTDTITFQQKLDVSSLWDKNDDINQEFNKKTMGEYMLETPSQRIKETKSNIEYIMESRRRAKEILGNQQAPEGNMDEVEREQKDRKANMATEEMAGEKTKDELERKKSGQPDREQIIRDSTVQDGLKAGGKADREKTNSTDKGVDDPKS